MTGRTISTLGDTIVHIPHTASAVHGTGAGITALGTGMPGHIIHGTTDTADGMADGTTLGITDTADGMIHGIMEAGTDTCTHTTADGTADGIHTGTTITTTARSMSVATRMTAGTVQGTAPALTESSPAGFPPAEA